MQTNASYPTEWPVHFANLVFGDLQLLIPQTDIYTLEPTIDMLPSVATIGSVGQLKQSDNVWSLYALSDDLTLLSHCPDTYRIAILMKNSQPSYGLLCEQVQTIARSELTIYPLPTVMNGENSPLLALAVYGDEVRYISSAMTLSRLFPQGMSE